MELYQKALTFATQKHYGQKRKYKEEDYIEHPKRVAYLVSLFSTNKNLWIAALLHDTLEDTDTVLEELEKEFNPLIANLVQELTNDEILKNKIGKSEMIYQKVKKLSSDAYLIKLCDRIDNLQSLYFAPQKDREQYLLQTQRMLEAIEERKKEKKENTFLIPENLLFNLYQNLLLVKE